MFGVSCAKGFSRNFFSGMVRSANIIFAQRTLRILNFNFKRTAGPKCFHLTTHYHKHGFQNIPNPKTTFSSILSSHFTPNLSFPTSSFKKISLYSQTSTHSFIHHLVHPISTSLLRYEILFNSYFLKVSNSN